MPRKADLRALDAVAAEFGLTGAARFAFGDYLEECKQHGDRGSRNARGDFTRDEMRQKAREFLGLPDGG